MIWQISQFKQIAGSAANSRIVVISNQAGQVLRNSKLAHLFPHTPLQLIICVPDAISAF